MVHKSLFSLEERTSVEHAKDQGPNQEQARPSAEHVAALDSRRLDRAPS